MMLPSRAATPLILTALTAAAAGCLAVVLLIPVPTPPGLAAGLAPRTFEVTGQSFTDERTVEVTLHIDSDQAVNVNTAGTVTASTCSPGKRLRSGRRMLRVDEHPVVALHTGVPLYRSLQPGDRGRDVRALQVELRRLGYPVTVSGQYQGSTARAVDAVLRAAGIARPTGRLDLADVAWLSRPFVVPTTCPVQPGQVVAAGAPVATAAGRLNAVSYPVPDLLYGGARRLTLFGVTSTAASATGEIRDSRFLNAVAATKAYLVARASKNDQRPTGSLALATAINALKVPPTALASIDGRRGCVEQDGVGIAVEIIGSGLGAALIRPIDPHVKLIRVRLGVSDDPASCTATPRPGRTP